jgi:hypothetical protein
MLIASNEEAQQTEGPADPIDTTEEKYVLELVELRQLIRGMETSFEDGRPNREQWELILSELNEMVAQKVRERMFRNLGNTYPPPMAPSITGYGTTADKLLYPHVTSATDARISLYSGDLENDTFDQAVKAATKGGTT